MSSIEITPSESVLIRQILAQWAPGIEVRVFGSRARGQARKTSDLDLVLMTKKPLELSQMAHLKEAFSQSALPFKVDIIDWSDISESFQKMIADTCQTLTRE